MTVSPCSHGTDVAPAVILLVVLLTFVQCPPSVPAPCHVDLRLDRHQLTSKPAGVGGFLRPFQISAWRFWEITFKLETVGSWRGGNHYFVGLLLAPDLLPGIAHASDLTPLSRALLEVLCCSYRTGSTVPTRHENLLSGCDHAVTVSSVVHWVYCLPHVSVNVQPGAVGWDLVFLSDHGNILLSVN